MLERRRTCGVVKTPSFADFRPILRNTMHSFRSFLTHTQYTTPSAVDCPWRKSAACSVSLTACPHTLMFRSLRVVTEEKARPVCDTGISCRILPRGRSGEHWVLVMGYSTEGNRDDVDRIAREAGEAEMGAMLTA
jgi:hypothetical protein